ncbi:MULTISPECIES: hypothetical protein [Photorhabdus]|uniref:DNA-binding protein n=2 Tax=Photorhabdus TaxID=29487 RepID=A0ABX0AWD7_9GAMM|nr:MULTISPECIES: hypothetical protein [Photorhabdus]MCC8376053.1 hypothetical protein [Photorhabdus bodei]MCT8350594.1 hypothetical protein [Photorhabdus kayaii]NDL11284.1 hypothetical protein [Photorhabdus kayaii]NDL24915.1 hypothetical protein [Photorhabdus kayaii]RAX10925.1 hypothetical protein CKY10_05735 [Photorhabdus sp. HUG-39]
MQIVNSIQAQSRWVTYDRFCELSGVCKRTAKYYVATGRLKIKPKKKSNERVFIDWWDWCKD